MMINIISNRKLIAIVVVILLVPVLGVGPVAAQEGDGNGNNNGGGGTSATDFATEVCNSNGYNIALGLAYVVIGLVFVALILGAAVGAGLISFGWMGRTVGGIAKKMLTGSVAGGILLLLTLTIVGIVIANVQIDIPQSCMWLFG